MRSKIIIPILVFCCAVFSTVCHASDNRADSNSITIFNGGAAQFELTSPGCPRILIDVVDAGKFQSEATSKDFLLVTHGDPDHYDRGYADSFPGQSLIIKEGVLTFDTGKITSIASTHSERPEDIFRAEKGSNYIFLVEMNGMRVAHFGDIGQRELTKKQLQTLGRVDIAITQFMNPYSQMDMQNKKAFNLMKQLSPKLIIPTAHGRYNQEVIKHAETMWRVYASTEEKIEFTKKSLPLKTTLLVWGSAASFLMEDNGLEEWGGAQ